MELRSLTIILVLLNVGLSNLFSPAILDILFKYDKVLMVTVLSCNYKDSFYLLKFVSNQQILIRISSINEKSLEHEPSQNKHIFIMDFECDNSTKILERANYLQLFLTPYKWIILHKTPLTAMKKHFEKIDILVDSDVNLIEQHETNSATLRKIYKYRTNHEIQVETTGFWDKEKGFKDFEVVHNIAKRRNNLKGIILNTCIVVTNNDTLNHLTDKRDRHFDGVTKVSYVLVEELAKIVNARLNYSIEFTWGYKNNNSEWDGLVGLLVEKKADIGGTPLFFTIDRIDIIDYIAMITPTRFAFVFREPKLSYVTNVFTLPFNKQVWISTIVLIIIIGLFLYYSFAWELQKQKYVAKKNKTNSKFTVLDVTLLAFGALCQQAPHFESKSVPSRITTIFLFLSLMFLYNSYVAHIVALLQTTTSNIQTLEDLSNSRFILGVHDNVFNRHYFSDSRDTIRRKTDKQKVAPPGHHPHYMPLVEGVKKMREGHFAFHAEQSAVYKLIGDFFDESEKCGLQQIDFLGVIDPWLAIQKNSSYKKLLKIGLRKIQETGIQSREVRSIYTKKPQCISRGSDFISVGLIDCYPAAVVLALGIIASFFIWIIEIIINNRKITSQKSRKQNIRTFWKQTARVRAEEMPYHYYLE